MSIEKKHVLAFAPDGKLFALVDQQGILRIWDTETNELKQEFTPNIHLSAPCTSLTWISVALAAGASAQERKEKKSRKSVEPKKEAWYLAMGTKKGQVLLYSYAEGKAIGSLKGEGHSGAVTDIVYDNSDKLYTSGADCQIIVWSLRQEQRIAAWNVGPEKPKSIAYAPISKSIVVGSRQIKVYSIEKQTLVQSFTGHTSEVSTICTFAANESQEYAVTTSKMERVICLWKLAKKGHNTTAACTLVMENVANCLTYKIQINGILQLASVTSSGVIHIHQLPLNNITNDKAIKPKVTLEIASDSTTVVEPIQALAAHYQYDVNRPQEILFAYGSKHVLVFERLTPNFKEKMNVLVRADPKKLYAAKHNKSSASGATDSTLKTVTPVIKYNEVEYQGALPLSKKKLRNEVPMESRLQNLNLGSDKPTAIQSQSKVQLLVQALHSRDDKLLHSVLCTKDTKTIEMTLERLPVQYVGTLVNELTLLMEMKRENVDYAVLWLKMLTNIHSSQLLAIGDDLHSKFGACLGLIEYRANCLKEVSKLSGRINLLVRMIKRNSEGDKLNEDNVLVVEDETSEPLDRSVFNDTVNENWSEGDEDDDLEIENNSEDTRKISFDDSEDEEDNDNEVLNVDDESDEDDDEDEVMELDDV